MCGRHGADKPNIHHFVREFECRRELLPPALNQENEMIPNLILLLLIMVFIGCEVKITIGRK